MRRDWTKPEEQQLRSLYSTLKISQIAVELGRTPTSVKNKANELRLSKNPSWTKAEIEYLNELIGTVPKNKLIAAFQRWATVNGFPNRTKVAIWERVKKSKQSRKVTRSGDWYSTKDVAEAFGCSVDTATDWFARYKFCLKPVARTNSPQGGQMVSRASLRRFVIQNPAIADRYQATIDLIWLIDLLGGN